MNENNDKIPTDDEQPEEGVPFKNTMPMYTLSDSVLTKENGQMHVTKPYPRKDNRQKRRKIKNK